MTKLGLLGQDISHSKSQEVYETILQKKINYQLFDYSSKKIPTLESIFSSISGLSITSPHKKHFLKNVKLVNCPVEFEAINCIRRVEGSFEATNTDYLALKKILCSLNYSKIVLLGGGAMARMILYHAKKTNVLIKNFTRKEHGALEKLKIKGDQNTLIINACARSFLFEGDLPMDSCYWNLNYHQKNQESIIREKCSYIDGMNLLVEQAKFALNFWNIPFST